MLKADGFVINTSIVIFEGLFCVTLEYEFQGENFFTKD